MGNDISNFCNRAEMKGGNINEKVGNNNIKL